MVFRIDLEDFEFLVVYVPGFDRFFDVCLLFAIFNRSRLVGRSKKVQKYNRIR